LVGVRRVTRTRRRHPVAPGDREAIGKEAAPGPSIPMGMVGMGKPLRQQIETGAG